MKHRLTVATFLAALVSIPSCSSEGQSQPHQTAEINLDALGKWVASCTDISSDSESLYEDLKRNAPMVLRSPAFTDQQENAASRALQPLANCESTEKEYLAMSLPSAWQTSGAQRVAEIIYPESTRTPSSSGCLSCIPTDSLEFEHSKWGRATLTTYAAPHGEHSPSDPWGYKVTDEGGRTVFDKEVHGSPVYDLKIKGQDTNQNIFLSYNPGRYYGIIVLRATEEGIHDFGSDSFPSTYNGRFYYAEVQPQTDGTHEIVLSKNNCHPSCATGLVTSENWKYDTSLDDFIRE